MGYLFFAFLFFGLLKGSGLLRGKLWLLFILLRLCNLFLIAALGSGYCNYAVALGKAHHAHRSEEHTSER